MLDHDITLHVVARGDADTRARALAESEDCVALAQHEHLYVARAFIDAAAVERDIAYIVGQPNDYIHMLVVPQRLRKRGFGRAVVRAFQPRAVYNALPETLHFWRDCGFVQNSDVENELVRATTIEQNST
jgi:hypothetical protein